MSKYVKFTKAIMRKGVRHPAHTTFEIGDNEVEAAVKAGGILVEKSTPPKGHGQMGGGMRMGVPPTPPAAQPEPEQEAPAEKPEPKEKPVAKAPAKTQKKTSSLAAAAKPPAKKTPAKSSK